MNFIVDVGMWYIYIVKWKCRKRVLHLLQFRFTRSDDGMHIKTHLSMLLMDVGSMLYLVDKGRPNVLQKGDRLVTSKKVKQPVDESKVCGDLRCNGVRDK